MTALSLLAIAAGEPDDKAALAIAADLARRHGGRALVVDAFTAVMPLVSPVGAGGAYAPRVWAAIADDRRDAHEHIKALAGHEAARFGLATAADAEAPAMVVAPASGSAWAALQRELPLIDLVVAGQSSAVGRGAWTGPLGEALMEARAPVLVARGEVPPAGRSAAIAWDGSFQSARAVRAALPLLKDASEVAILQDPDEIEVTAGARADPQRLKDYLSMHGVAVETTVEIRGRSIGEALLTAANAFGAALLVAGAYGHSRLGEAMVGGATRSLLAAAEGPHLLLSH